METPQIFVFIDIAAKPGRGKTTIARTIAEALAEAGCTVNVFDDEPWEGLPPLDLVKQAIANRGVTVTIRTHQINRQASLLEKA